MKIKSLLPHLIAVVLFTVMAFAYFYPVLEGKTLKANDSMVAKIYSREITEYRAEFNKEPLWTNSQFSGMPAYLISTQYPGNLFKKIDTLLRIFGMPVAVLFLSFAGFYVLLLMFRVNPWLAMAGAAAYGFSSFFMQIIAAGHNTQSIALAYMAPVIGGIYYAYRENAIKGSLLAAVFLSLQLSANHPQMTYYSGLCVLIFILIEFIYSLKEKRFLKFMKASAFLAGALIIAIGVNFAFLHTTAEYGKYSMRGKSDLISESNNITPGLKKDYIVQWSYGIGETMNLLIPDFKGGSSHPFDKDSQTYKILRQNGAAAEAGSLPKYWGDQPVTEGPAYMGAIVVFLFILGLILVKDKVKWWLLIAVILAIMLSWGKNFMALSDLFIDYFPGYNKFRSVTFILVIVQFCMPLLGILALKEVYYSESPREKMVKGFLTALSITAGILLFFLIIPAAAGTFLTEYESPYPGWLKDTLIADRKGLLRADAFRSLIFILLGSGAILAFMFNKLKKEYSILIVGLLILLDLFSVDKRYLNADRFVRPNAIQKSLSQTTADGAILKDKSYYRVWNRTVPTFQDNTPTSWYHKSIGGYHGAKLRRYQELIDSSLSRDIVRFESAARNVQSEEEAQRIFNETWILNMLNTKYVIYNPDAPPLLNNRALGNAWFVENAVLAENANRELEILNEINTSKTAVIDKVFTDHLNKRTFDLNEGDKIELKSYQPNELVYKCTSGGERLVIFSEIYYPGGWKCYVDGNESSHFRADYVLRAMMVPEGEHEIKFVFDPDSYKTGNKVSLASSILLILLAAGFFGMKLIKK